MIFRFFPVLVLISFGSTLFADEQVFATGNGQRVLMELYTSEGCSSCPPMERYLNSFRDHGRLWEGYIPVAFHVDYWNYIGWEDRFASPRFTERQRRHAREGNVRSVYTPALIVNGKAWRPSLTGRLAKPNTRSTGRLRVRVDQNRLIADFEPAEVDTRSFELHVALLGMGLESSITAGENEGRSLEHDFVVIGFGSLAGRNGHWHTRLPEPHYPGADARALAVWVTESDSLKPLQAVGGYLDEDR